MFVRPYESKDYESVAILYKDSALYGGQFDPLRDSSDKLDQTIKADPDSILVCLDNNDVVVGTVTLLENPRTAWLFRFAVKDNSKTVSQILYDASVDILSQRGHKVILVYSEANNRVLDDRYESLGMTKGGSFTCFWQDI